MGNVEVRERADGEGNSRGGATKKREISRTSLPINLHFSEDADFRMLLRLPHLYSGKGSQFYHIDRE